MTDLANLAASFQSKKADWTAPQTRRKTNANTERERECVRKRERHTSSRAVQSARGERQGQPGSEAAQRRQTPVMLFVLVLILCANNCLIVSGRGLSVALIVVVAVLVVVVVIVSVAAAAVAHANGIAYFLHKSIFIY